MDYETARGFLIGQGNASSENTDAFLNRLKAGKPPIPGQVTSILLALKMVYNALEGTPSLSRELAGPLYRIAVESREAYEQGDRQGVNWPPLLDEDLERIARAAGSIFAGSWQD